MTKKNILLIILGILIVMFAMVLFTRKGKPITPDVAPVTTGDRTVFSPEKTERIGAAEEGVNKFMKGSFE